MNVSLRCVTFEYPQEEYPSNVSAAIAASPMPITILFFGALTELTRTDRLLLDTETDGISDLAKLRMHLERLYPGLTGKPYRTAINLEFAGESDPLRDGDEVAFLPPYAGG